MFKSFHNPDCRAARKGRQRKAKLTQEYHEWGKRLRQAKKDRDQIGYSHAVENYTLVQRRRAELHNSLLRRGFVTGWEWKVK